MSNYRDNAGRFAPGKSGNPDGRPKKQSGVDAAVTRAAGERVTIVEQGKRKRVPKFDVAVAQLVNAAASGDRHSIKLIMEALRAAEERAEVEAVRAPVMTQPDHEIATRVIDRMKKLILEGNTDENADA